MSNTINIVDETNSNSPFRVPIAIGIGGSGSSLEAKGLAHPCFNEEAKHTSARVHLPVAPKCNIQCNYCNRKFDCVNESRPGVTSSVLAPSHE